MHESLHEYVCPDMKIHISANVDAYNACSEKWNLHLSGARMDYWDGRRDLGSVSVTAEEVPTERKRKKQ